MLFPRPFSALPTWQVQYGVQYDVSISRFARIWILQPPFSSPTPACILLITSHQIKSTSLSSFCGLFFCGFLSACPTLGLRSPWTCMQCVCLCLLFVVPRITWRNTSQVNQTNQPTNQPTSQTCDIVTNSCRRADQRIQTRRWHACMHAWDEPANHPFSPLETSNKQRHAHPHIHTHLTQSRQLASTPSPGGRGQAFPSARAAFRISWAAPGPGFAAALAQGLFAQLAQRTE
ncbi:hypothetical protein BKA61DRAFT_294780 [Leptodontidium sp. MPI-SDFR-AT-0119]|nr:hypothetical protein BKA61DRAFT_294780 [Leptodontidium sp. MPI-SDFR-AT-0119]